MVIDTIKINVAALNYDKQSHILKQALLEIETMVHSKDEFKIGAPQFTFGWYFFTVSVSRNLIVKTVNLHGNEFLGVKGKSFEKKFVNWLTARLEQLGSDMHLNLKSEMESSQFGLF